MGRIFRFLRAYRRRIAISLLLAYATFILIHPDEEGRISDLIWFGVLVMFIASQLFWIRRVVDVGKRFLPGKPRRVLLEAMAGVICLMSFVYNLATWNSEAWNSTHVSTALTLRSVLLEAPFWWWFVGSFAGFILVLAFWGLDHAGDRLGWIFRKTPGIVSGRDGSKADTVVFVPASPAGGVSDSSHAAAKADTIARVPDWEDRKHRRLLSGRPR